MTRRSFSALVASLAVWPLSAQAAPSSHILLSGILRARKIDEDGLPVIVTCRIESGGDRIHIGNQWGGFDAESAPAMVLQQYSDRRVDLVIRGQQR